MTLEHLVGPESNKVPKNKIPSDGNMSKGHRSQVKGFPMANLEQSEQKNKRSSTELGPKVQDKYP